MKLTETLANPTRHLELLEPVYPPYDGGRRPPVWLDRARGSAWASPMSADGRGASA